MLGDRMHTLVTTEMHRTTRIIDRQTLEYIILIQTRIMHTFQMDIVHYNNNINFCSNTIKGKTIINTKGGKWNER